MKDGICPKCHSTNVFTKERGTWWGEGLRLSTRFMDKVDLHYQTYICTECGYFENYVTDKDELAKVAEKWERVK